MIQAFGQAHPVATIDEDDPIHEVRKAFSQYLGQLFPDLEREAARADWRIGDVEGHPWLLIPCYDIDNELVAVRGFRTNDRSPWVLLATEDATPQTVLPRFDSQHSIVTHAPGGPKGPDVPFPLVSKSFDQPFVWVSRNPVDVLILQSLKVNAVSLATPAATLGSEEGVRGLEALGVLSTQRECAGIVAVVDPEAQFGAYGASLLCGLFEHVWKDEVPEQRNGYLALSGRGLAANLQSFWQRPTSDAEAMLFGLMGQGGRRYKATQVRLSALDPDGFQGASTRKPLELIPADGLRVKGDMTPWLVKPFVAARAVTDFHGPAKAGKTTFLLSLCAAVAQGTTFLGRESKKSAVVYVTEQTAGTIRKSAERAGGIADGVHFLTIEATFGWDFVDVVRFVRAECKSLKARLVVFDTLGPIAGLWGESENASGTARHVYRTLRALSVDGIAVVVVRHSRKARGSIVETGAGSVAFSGEADQLVRFTKPTENSQLRTVEVVGRLSDSKTLTVRFRKGVWKKAKAAEVAAGKAGTRKAGEPEPSAREAVLRVLGHIGSEGATRDEIAALTMDVGGRRKALLSVRTVSKELSILVKEGAVLRDTSMTAEKARHWLTFRGTESAPSDSIPTGSTLTHSHSPPEGE